MSIRINATVNEARAAAGHNKEQWDRFYFITKDEAKQLSEAHPDWQRWILIPANEKEEMLKRINARLVSEDIPAVEMIILKWRMSQLLRDIQRKYTEGEILRAMSPNAGSRTQSDTGSPNYMQHSPTPQPSELSPSESRPYDPIRGRISPRIKELDLGGYLQLDAIVLRTVERIPHTSESSRTPNARARSGRRKCSGAEVLGGLWWEIISLSDVRRLQ